MTDLNRLPTSHCSIVVEEAGRGNLPVLLIHGNLLSHEVFRKQLGGALPGKYRLFGLDLPGHGDSGDALSASRTYARPGLANAAFGAAIFGAPIPVAFRRAIARADGLARKSIFEAARSGVGIDQRELVENSPVPLAIVNGAEDPIINLDYLEVPEYANLRGERCHRLPRLKHAPFWEAPEIFDELLGAFIDDVAAR